VFFQSFFLLPFSNSDTNISTAGTVVTASISMIRFSTALPLVAPHSTTSHSAPVPRGRAAMSILSVWGSKYGESVHRSGRLFCTVGPQSRMAFRPGMVLVIIARPRLTSVLRPPTKSLFRQCRLNCADSSRFTPNTFRIVFACCCCYHYCSR
jgi:hypothetical protein